MYEASRGRTDIAASETNESAAASCSHSLKISYFVIFFPMDKNKSGRLRAIVGFVIVLLVIFHARQVHAAVLFGTTLAVPRCNFKTRIVRTCMAEINTLLTEKCLSSTFEYVL